MPVPSALVQAGLVGLESRTDNTFAHRRAAEAPTAPGPAPCLDAVLMLWPARSSTMASMPRALEPGFVGRTYDDFLFRPQRGIVSSRQDVSLRTRLSRRLEMQLPVISANMDSVTEARMARTMALEGGLGFIHRAMPVEEQAELVRRVKRTHGFLVDQPMALPRGTTIGEAVRVTRAHNVSGLLIEESPGSGILAGLLSHRDVPPRGAGREQPVDRFMTPFDRLVTAPPGISMEDAEALMFAQRVEKLPLVDEHRRIQGLITMRDILLARRRPYSTRDLRGRLMVGGAIGARGDYLERAGELIRAGVDLILIDVAHAHAEMIREAVEAFRARYGDAELAVGNVGTGEGARYLVDLGVDAVKVGIGPGRGCRTRLETAAGVPQLQAIREVWCAIGEEVPIIADGGVKDDKDLFLALVCGASSVMLGSLLSGTDEAPGHVIEDPATREKRKIYRGMTSPQAVFEALYDEGSDLDLDGGAGSNRDEEANGALESALAVPAEGQEIQVPYHGSVIDILHRIRGHLRSSVSYGGGGSLREVRDRVVVDPMAYLIPLSEASRRESYER